MQLELTSPTLKALCLYQPFTKTHGDISEDLASAFQPNYTDQRHMEFTSVMWNDVVAPQ